MSHVQVEPKALKTVGCVGVFLVTDARSATFDLLIGSGSIRGALPSTCVSAAREAGQLDVVLRRVETGADPAYDLAVDYDRKTGSRCRVAARRLMRVSMFDRTDVRDWGCRTDRPNERRTAALAPQRTEPKSLLLLREGLPPSCVPPRQSRLTPDPAL